MPISPPEEAAAHVSALIDALARVTYACGNAAYRGRAVELLRECEAECRDKADPSEDDDFMMADVYDRVAAYIEDQT